MSLPFTHHSPKLLTLSGNWRNSAKFLLPCLLSVLIKNADDPTLHFAILLPNCQRVIICRKSSKKNEEGAMCIEVAGGRITVEHNVQGRRNWRTRGTIDPHFGRSVNSTGRADYTPPPLMSVQMDFTQTFEINAKCNIINHF